MARRITASPLTAPKVRKTQKPKKKNEKKEETIQKSKPKTPKKDVSSQYNDFKQSSFAPKTVTPKKKKEETSLQSAQKAFSKGQRVRSQQQKRGVTNTSVAKPKANIIADFSKPKGYDYKTDLQKAAKKGSETTYLGTKQKKKKTTLTSGVGQVKKIVQQRTNFYNSDDWKNVKNELKVKNQEGWRKALSDQGWSRKEIDDWMNSEEGKVERKKTYMEAKNATKDSINKSIAKGVKDSSYLESVNALSKGEFNRMMDAQKYGKEKGNKLLEGSERMGTKDIREKVGSKTAQSAYESPFMTGVLQGTAKGDIFSSSVGTYNEGAKSAIEATKNKGSYLAGYGVGLAADMAMGGVASRGASVAEGVGKGVAKLAGKEVAKEVPRKALQEATEEMAKLSGKQGLGRFAKNRAGELVAETPTNVLDAVKMSLDTDGNLDKKEFRKWLAMNSAFTAGVGGAMEGVGAGLTRKLGNETIELLGKREAGTITEEELKKLNKNIKKLSSKQKGGIQTMSNDIATKRMDYINAKDAAKKASVTDNRSTRGFSPSRSRGATKVNAPDVVARKAQAEKIAEGNRRVATRKANESTSKVAETARQNRLADLNERMKTLVDRESELITKVNGDNTIQGHARAVAELEEVRKALKITKQQLKQARSNTLSGKVADNMVALKRDNTLAGHEKLAREADAIRAEGKASADRAFADSGDSAFTKGQEARVRARLEEQGYPKHITEKSPKEIAEQIAHLDKEVLPDIEKKIAEAQKNQRKAWANGDSRGGASWAENYNEYKAYKDEVLRELQDLGEARQIYTEALGKAEDVKLATKETPTEVPKAETPEGGFAKFDDAELERVNLSKTKKESGIELKPKEGESVYQAHQNHTSERKEADQKRKNLTNKEKAETEAKGLKSAWKKFYSMFVSELEPWERMAMSATTREERKRGRVTINGLLTARSKAMTKIRNEGMAIFEKRGLHKNAEKAAEYDDYALFMHDLDRIKQKSISVYKDNKHFTIDFGEGVIVSDGKRVANLPDGKWNNYRNMSEADIKKDIEKYVRDNGYEWDGLIDSKSFTGYTENTLNSLISELKKKYGKDISDFQEELVEYHKDLLKEDQVGGIISKERYEKLLQKYPNYIPTYRDYDAIASRSFNEDFRAVNLYAAKGAEDANQIIPQYTQMVAKTNTVMKRVAENEMLNVISRINNISIKDLPGGHTPDELLEASSGVYIEKNTGHHMVYFRQNGKGVSMRISDEAYHAIRQWSGAERAAIMEFKLMENKGVRTAAKGLTNASRAFKALITDYSIIFGCRNFVRDSATALVYSEHPAQWLVNFPKAVMAMKKGTKYNLALEQYIKDGGRYNALVTSTDLSKMPKLNSKEGIPGLRLIKDFNTTMETLPRMSEYISTVERLAKKDGLSFEDALANRKITQEAMYNAKEVTLNFDRAGQYGRMLNRGFVPFFNPSVQGIDKLARFLVKDNKSMSEFMAMGAKMAGMVVAPTLAWEYFVNQSTHPGTGDEGMGEAYRKLSAYNKYAYFCIPMGKDENGDWEFLKIPRAREMAAMQMPIDWFIQNVKYQNRDGTANLFESAKQAGRLTIEQIGPVNPLTDNYFSPIWNLAHNKNWMGGRIEGFEDEGKRKKGLASDIFDSDTSSAAVTIMSLVNAKQNSVLKKLGLGSDVTNWIKQHQVSPKQLDNVFDSYLGVIYDMGIRPFSQQGASLKSVKENPVEETKRWLDTTFGTAFVVNGTLSSQRKSGMYAELYDMKSKLDDYEFGSKEYAETNKKLMQFQNRVVYDVQGLDTAIDAINRSNKYTGREKAELTKALKREQNAIIDDYKNGKSTMHDPLKTLLDMKDAKGKRVFSDDEVFTKMTYTNKKSGTNSIASGWESLKSSDYYKEHPKKAVREFKEITFATRDVAGRMNDSKSFMDWQTMAVVCADKTAQGGKDYSNILDSYNVSKGKRKVADVYINQMGGSAKTYVASHRHIVDGAAELGVYPSELKDHDYAMILANAKTKTGNKLKDRAYWVEDNKYGSSSYAYQRMNYARCLSSEKYAESKWSYKKVHKFADTYNLDYSSPDEKIVNAINKKYPNKSDEEKAALFGVIKPTDENPFGNVGDYSVDGDTGYEIGGHGRGRRRGRRRRGGGGGGSGGATFTPEINTAGKNAKVTNTSKTNTSSKSNLDDAYRKKLKKLREGTRSKVKL